MEKFIIIKSNGEILGYTENQLTAINICLKLNKDEFIDYKYYPISGIKNIENVKKYKLTKKDIEKQFNRIKKELREGYFDYGCDLVYPLGGIGIGIFTEESHNSNKDTIHSMSLYKGIYLYTDDECYRSYDDPPIRKNKFKYISKYSYVWTYGKDSEKLKELSENMTDDEYDEYLEEFVEKDNKRSRKEERHITKKIIEDIRKIKDEVISNIKM